MVFLMGRNEDERNIEQIYFGNYPPYKQFMRRVGGSHRLIPDEHTKSQMIKIRYDELMNAFIPDSHLDMDEETRILIEPIDTLHGYRRGIEKNYLTGIHPMPRTTLAIYFFEQHILNPTMLNNLTQQFRYGLDQAKKELRADPILVMQPERMKSVLQELQKQCALIQTQTYIELLVNRLLEENRVGER